MNMNTDGNAEYYEPGIDGTLTGYEDRSGLPDDERFGFDPEQIEPPHKNVTRDALAHALAGDDDWQFSGLEFQPGDIDESGKLVQNPVDLNSLIFDAVETRDPLAVEEAARVAYENTVWNDLVTPDLVEAAFLREINTVAFGDILQIDELYEAFKAGFAPTDLADVVADKFAKEAHFSREIEIEGATAATELGRDPEEAIGEACDDAYKRRYLPKAA